MCTMPPNFKRLVVDTCFFCIGHPSDKPDQVGVRFAVYVLFRCQRRKTDRVDWILDRCRFNRTCTKDNTHQSIRLQRPPTLTGASSMINLAGFYRPYPISTAYFFLVTSTPASQGVDDQSSWSSSSPGEPHLRPNQLSRIRPRVSPGQNSITHLAKDQKNRSIAHRAIDSTAVARWDHTSARVLAASTAKKQQ